MHLVVLVIMISTSSESEKFADTHNLHFGVILASITPPSLLARSYRDLVAIMMPSRILEHVWWWRDTTGQGVADLRDKLTTLLLVRFPFMSVIG